MDQPLKQRLIGAAVLAALAVIFLPMLLKGPDVREPDAEEVPLTMPATPGTDFETRELPLTVPEPAPPGGVLGMDGKPPVADAAPAGASADAGVPADAVPDLAPGDATAVQPAPAASAPPAASTAPAPVGAGGGDYVVAVGVFADVANARGLAAKLRAAGLPVRADSVPVAGKDGLRLRVGPYEDRAAAEAARLRAQAATNVSGKVIALDGSALPAAPAPKPGAPTVAAASAKPAPTTAASATTAAGKPAVAAPAPASAAVVPAPASTPAPAGEAPAKVSAGFAVQLSAPAAEADANTLRDKARAAGFPSFVQRTESETGTRWRVRIGPFADRAAADAARDAANGKLGTHGIVMRHP